MEKNKKILLISWTQNYTESGAQKYSYVLSKILHKYGYDIKEMFFFDRSDRSINNPLPFVEYYSITNKKESKSINRLKFILISFKTKKIIKNEIKNNDYNLIIYNTASCPGIKTNIKSAYILHTKPSIIFNKYKEFLKRILGLKNGIYYSDIAIVQSKYYSNEIIKLNKNILTKEINPFYEEHHIKNISNTKKYIYYIGRTDSFEKRIDLINDVSGLLKEKIRVIGNYSNETKDNYKNLVFLGPMKIQEIYSEISKDAKALILLSDYEGLPLTSCEGFSCGIPLILRNSFECAPFLINNGENGILLDNNMNAVEIAECINNNDFNKYDKSKIIKFAKDNFSYDLFEKKWNELINNLR